METPAPDPPDASTAADVAAAASAPSESLSESSTAAAGFPIDAAFEAIASPVRRSILDVLRDGRMCTTAEVAAAVEGVSASSASRHLRVLRDADLVVATKVGRSLHYTIAAGPLEAIHRTWLSGFLAAAETVPDADTGTGEGGDEGRATAATGSEPEQPAADDAVERDAVERDAADADAADADPAGGAEPEPEPRSAQDLMARISQRLGSMPRERPKRPEPRFPSPLRDDAGDDAPTRRPFTRLDRSER